jgi:hypothetical protein
MRIVMRRMPNASMLCPMNIKRDENVADKVDSVEPHLRTVGGTNRPIHQKHDVDWVITVIGGGL